MAASCRGVRCVSTSEFAELTTIARETDSVVGGTGEGPAGPHLSRAAFWGICDLKYDSTLPARDRVKLLELGDARKSRFSHDGRGIKTAFDSQYRMSSDPLDRAALVENKVLTHLIFVQEGFSHLRPLTGCYPRCYSADLASRIMRDLKLDSEEALVLKLCNRSRGAGVFVCPVPQLDATLRHFLQPPSGAQLQKWFEENSALAWHSNLDSDPFTEHKLHFWSNESPVFLAERLCRSAPVRLEGEDFDGTMRCSFVLDEAGSLHWVGAYWKLPPAPLERSGGGLQLAVLRDCTVSSFKGAEKRTAPVDEAQAREVFDSLGTALQKVIFQPRDSCSDPYVKAFMLARTAASANITDAAMATQCFKDAQLLLPDTKGLPGRGVLSYIKRSLGSLAAQLGNWDEARQKYDEALGLLPTNATALYLQGVCIQERGDFSQAVPFHLRSFALDPDFRSPLLALAGCKAFLGMYSDALKASLICLRRHPDAYVAQYNIGQALYQLLREGCYRDLEEAKELRARALEALSAARARHPVLWSASDDAVVRYLKAAPGLAREALPRQPVNVWKCYLWRP